MLSMAIEKQNEVPDELAHEVGVVRRRLERSGEEVSIDKDIDYCLRKLVVSIKIDDFQEGVLTQPILPAQ